MPENAQETQTRSLVAFMAEKSEMEPGKFLKTLKASVLKGKDGREPTNEETAVFLVMCKENGLNPLMGHVHGFVGRDGKIHPIMGIDGWLKMANEHPAFDGMEFDDQLDEKGRLVAVTCNIYRKDRDKPVSLTEYMDECKQNSGPWQKWPARMLRHKATIQAIRYAFSFAGIIDPDEAERFVKSGFHKGGVLEKQADYEVLPEPKKSPEQQDAEEREKIEEEGKQVFGGNVGDKAGRYETGAKKLSIDNDTRPGDTEPEPKPEAPEDPKVAMRLTVQELIDEIVAHPMASHWKPEEVLAKVTKHDHKGRTGLTYATIKDIPSKKALDGVIGKLAAWLKGLGEDPTTPAEKLPAGEPPDEVKEAAAQAKAEDEEEGPDF